MLLTTLFLLIKLPYIYRKKHWDLHFICYSPFLAHTPLQMHHLQDPSSHGYQQQLGFMGLSLLLFLLPDFLFSLSFLVKRNPWKCSTTCEHKATLFEWRAQEEEFRGHGFKAFHSHAAKGFCPSFWPLLMSQWHPQLHWLLLWWVHYQSLRLSPSIFIFFIFFCDSIFFFSVHFSEERLERENEDIFSCGFSLSVFYWICFVRIFFFIIMLMLVKVNCCSCK